MESPLRIIQISDIHMFADKGSSLMGVDTSDSFAAVIDLLKNEKKIDIIILSGDLSQDGSKVSYMNIAEALKDFNIPIYFVPGNHDDVHRMAQVYPLNSISKHKHIILKDWHLILLNSQVPEHVEGHLDASQISYMQHCLQTYPEHHAIVLFHHHPFPIGCQWLDEIGVKNADEFWHAVSHYPKVSTVLFGHIHQVVEREYQGIQCYSAPSTCFQFRRQHDTFGIEKLNPGYRWIDLYEDGKIETGVVRTAEYIGIFDPNSKGYA